jgi:hypothetical protein
METTNIKKENHIEISSGGTLIVSSENCPLKECPEKQLFTNINSDSIVCCCIEGQPWTNKDFMCPFFEAVVSDKYGIRVKCTHV